MLSSILIGVRRFLNHLSASVKHPYFHRSTMGPTIYHLMKSKLCSNDQLIFSGIITIFFKPNFIVSVDFSNQRLHPSQNRSEDAQIDHYHNLEDRFPDPTSRVVQHLLFAQNFLFYKIFLKVALDFLLDAWTLLIMDKGASFLSN